MAFMMHPDHGATYTNDVEGHEKNGWKVSTPDEWLAKKKPDMAKKKPETVALPVIVAEPEAPIQARPGRPKRDK